MDEQSQLWSLLDLRDSATPEAERRALQALQDCELRFSDASRNLQRAEERLLGLAAATGKDDAETLLILAARSEVVREVSGLRATYCKASTAGEEAALRLDRVRVMRRVYKERIARVA